MKDTSTPDAPSPPTRWQKIRATWWGRWGIDLLLLATLFWGISAYQTRNLIARNTPAPPVTLVNLADGSELSLNELNAERTLVYFWATWCGVCKAQSPVINAMHRHAKDRDDVHVISVVMDWSDRESLKAFVAENNIDYPVYLGTDAMAAGFNVQSYPTIYVIDDHRQVRHSIVGYTPRLGLLARLHLL
ncbi:thiol:disulfide interchange protein [Lujinxingia litoralis]|uniref:Thiol:disulfide interchange protein n=1 Tax=Lujinxingia litoralis TaxID=2211119 RepID=A0A328C9C1_9DELT|nr:TlpA disulfide reductase family protein [Lujinxingia litoralis]RAL22233.1 thiol:disulfide interchange protein [Lujinxingia litoralis]